MTEVDKGRLSLDDRFSIALQNKDAGELSLIYRDRLVEALEILFYEYQILGWSEHENDTEEFQRGVHFTMHREGKSDVSISIVGTRRNAKYMEDRYPDLTTKPIYIRDKQTGKLSTADVLKNEVSKRFDWFDYPGRR